MHIVTEDVYVPSFHLFPKALGHPTDASAAALWAASALA